MAVYKVAQDVEADDKLIGPFSFRQFVYLLIVAMAIGIAWGLSRLFLPLFIIPLPIILFFGALALPLRKDQPMEIYMAAIVSYHLKPKKRLWVPDGIESLVEITAPKVIEENRTKDLSQFEAERRLSYLADIADTEGWAIRHAALPPGSSSMVSDVFYEAQQTPDVLDNSTGVGLSLSTMIDRADEQRRQDAISRMHQATAVPQTATPVQPTPPAQPMYRDPYAALGQQPQDIATPVVTEDSSSVTPEYNPYPTNIHQHIVQPIGDYGRLDTPAPESAAQPPQDVAAVVDDTPPVPEEPQNEPSNTSEMAVSPDIINLANNTDLSIETIQREANRIQEKNKKDDEGEVFISLR